MNTMRKEIEQGKYMVILENGTVYHEVPCLGAYDSEREVLRDLCDDNGYGGKGIFNEKSYDTGIVFYYTDEPDRSKYIFVKADKGDAELIWEEVFMVEER